MKKIVFGSDVHGSATAGRKLIEAVSREKADKLFLCGDIYYHGPRNPLPCGHAPMDLADLLNTHKDILRCVKGNCDCEVDAMISEFEFENQILFDFFGKKIFVTHGHVYDKNNPPPLLFDIMIYGHYHIGFIEKRGGKIFASPGSVSLPKAQSVPAYLVLTERDLTLKDLNGNELEKLEINR